MVAMVLVCVSSICLVVCGTLVVLYMTQVPGSIPQTYLIERSNVSFFNNRFLERENQPPP